MNLFLSVNKFVLRAAEKCDCNWPLSLKCPKNAEIINVGNDVGRALNSVKISYYMLLKELSYPNMSVVSFMPK